MNDRAEGRGAEKKTALRTSAAMWFLASASLIGLVVATIVSNPTLIVAFLIAIVVFPIAAILTLGIYGFNRLLEHIMVISKRG